MITGTFRSTVANSRGTVAGSRDIGSEERVAEKEDHTWASSSYWDDTEHDWYHWVKKMKFLYICISRGPWIPQSISFVSAQMEMCEGLYCFVVKHVLHSECQLEDAAQWNFHKVVGRENWISVARASDTLQLDRKWEENKLKTDTRGRSFLAGGGNFQRDTKKLNIYYCTHWGWGDGGRGSDLSFIYFGNFAP